ncbi:MAG: AAA family ATPase [Crocosphaera sp.]
MKIIKLEYEERDYNWKLNPVEFSPNLNLLVGVSGAGKTRILESINKLKEVANGVSSNQCRWDITFSTKDNVIYRWRGEFDNKFFRDFIIDQYEPRIKLKIISEYLDRNNRNIITRNNVDGINFKGTKTPRLSPYESVVKLLDQEEDISPVQTAFNEIINSENIEVRYPFFIMPDKIAKKYDNYTFNKIKNSELPISFKLALVYQYHQQVFNEIKTDFMQIFSTVEDIKISSTFEDRLSFYSYNSLEGKTVFLIKIKEKDVDFWIWQQDISSGMFKTLMYISELYLGRDDSVILIDEFENSLGVNCIESVTDLICENKSLQFIITSHHPYIINNISPGYWKIVTRKGGEVSVKTAEDFHIPSSRQKAFLKLINILEDYPEGLKD